MKITEEIHCTPDKDGNKQVKTDSKVHTYIWLVISDEASEQA